ncbi:NAD-dependent epimerase/dehydratase family protein [Sediminispirochaeta bajacaliforniensis]|uniref:NAD-dependent epimerase/dehydratase family protein n=1 Tax=Sediminispirochaeta bajacaliforniensis TaxID=148 RepID=UPI000365A948|nr:NAD-dependent epimerase/dehydratase family protein [Sediminispirochaeta bajacaliforniensis]
MNKDTLLVVGASGFVGKNIIEQLYEKYRIIAVDKKVDDSFFRSFLDVVSIEADITNLQDIEDIIDLYPPNFVVNLVSIVSAERDLSMFSSLIETNLKVLINLFETLQNKSSLRLFVQFGSAEEYGSLCPVPFRECDREYPDSPYALIKQATTNTTLMLHRNYDFPSMVIRPGNLFGKYQSKDKLIPYLMDKLYHGENIEMTPGKQERDFIYCSDLVVSLDGLLGNYKHAIGKIVNIASGVGISLRSLVESAKSLLDSDSKIKFGALPYRKNEMMHFQCDVGLLKSLIPNYRVTDFKIGLYSYLEFLKRSMED